SESHPFYTGAQSRVLETGRVEKFRQKFARAGGAKRNA
ncbi:MAG: type B 50S ribosomal protein L31, partial [Betaproteobacteria bacterium]|nr:type B 50S ribosomal protein L31 [Betaproteobacteria bacterium]